jgi:hypothetical protein
VGLVPLDEGAFQHQRFKLRVGHNDIEVVDGGDHGPCLVGVRGQIGKVLAHPILEGLGLAHIDDGIVFVLHDINARL